MNFPLALLLASSVSTSAAASVPHALQTHPWTVEHVIPGAPDDPTYDYLTHNIWPNGDIDSDGLTDFSTYADDRSDPFSGNAPWSIAHFYSGARIGLDFEVRANANTSRMYLETSRLRLNTPYGVMLLLDGELPMIQAYSQESGALLGSITQPPPPAPGIPPPANMNWLYAAGDVNADGWDDAFYMTFAQPYGYCGLIDGASLTVVWQHYRTGVDSPLDFIHGLPRSYPDLNGDGISDFFFGDLLWNGSQFGRVVSAHSGVDGQVLWQRTASGVSLFRLACGLDLNADGVGDLILHNSSLIPTMEAWSGADGALLWSTDLRGVDPFFPASHTTRTFEMPLMSMSAASGEPVILLKATYYYWTQPSFITRLAEFDGRSGIPLRATDLPADLQPWSSDAFLTNGSPNAALFPAGDVDGDGLQEYAGLIDDPGATPPWVTSGYSRRIVIIGEQNLVLPTSARVGTSFSVSLRVPSAPQHDYLLLAATAFDPAGGFTLQGRQTGLDSGDPYFLRAWSSRALHGTLNAEGYVQRTLALPAQPGLIGQRLYFRALVGHAATGSLKTISSLAVLDVLP